MDHATSSVQFDALGVPKREECLYASCYCEENVWQLCKAIKDKDEAKLTPFYVAFISNQRKTIPLWHQRAGSGDDGFVIWDYHVVLLRTGDALHSDCMIYDFDTTLPFPCRFTDYFARAIRPDDTFRPCYRRKFRLIPASEYLAQFGSDRSHMRDDKGGWIRPPPAWPCIQNSQQTNTIANFWSMDNASDNFLNDVSEVLDTRQLSEKFRH